MAATLKSIPGGITPQEFMVLRDFLVQILTEANAKAVVMRLNKTGETNPRPVFVGWVEDQALVDKRTQNNEPDPGLFRFGDTNYSTMYNETLLAGQAVFREKIWNRPYSEKDDQSKALLPDADVLYQRYLGIVTGGGSNRHCVGTLSVALTDRPNNATLNSLDQVLTRWATDSASALVNFLQSNFLVSGPAV